MENSKVFWIILGVVGLALGSVAYSFAAQTQKMSYPFVIRSIVLNSQGNVLFLWSDEGDLFQALLLNDQGVVETITCEMEIAWEVEPPSVELDILGWSEGQLLGYSRLTDQPLFALIPAACDSTNRVALPKSLSLPSVIPTYSDKSCVQDAIFSRSLNRSLVLTCQGELYVLENVRKFPTYQEALVIAAPPPVWFYLLPALRLSFEKDGSQVVSQSSSLPMDNAFHFNSQITIWMEWSLDER